MRSSLRGVFSLILALGLALIATQSALARTDILAPPAPEVSLLDLTPGGSINFVGTIETPVGETPVNAQVGMEFGGTLVYSGVHAPAAGTIEPFIIAVPTDAIIANCVGGVFTYTYWNTSGGERATLTAECSTLVDVPPAPVVTPVLPTVQTEICGPGNDEITIPEQPAGIITNDPGWIENNRTVYFEVETGYVIDGVTSAEFVDNATACPVEEPVDPPAPAPEPPPVEQPVVEEPVAQAPAAPAVVTSLPSTGSGAGNITSTTPLAVIAAFFLAGTVGLWTNTCRHRGRA